MPLFGAGTSMWLTREARRHRKDEDEEVEMARTQTGGATAGAVVVVVVGGGGMEPQDGVANEDEGVDVGVNEGVSSQLLRRFAVYQAFAFLAGLVGEIEVRLSSTTPYACQPSR